MVTYVPVDYAAETTETLDVSRILGMLRRQIWLIAGVMALSLGVAAFMVLREKPRYRADALIRFTFTTDLDMILGSGGEAQSVKVDPRTSELMVLKSKGVLGEAVDREGLRLFSVSTGEPASFVKDVRVDLPPDQSFEMDVRFGPDGIQVRSGGKRATAAYGEPVELNGVRFTIASRQSEPQKLIVYSRDAAINYVSPSINSELVPTADGVYINFVSSDRKVASRVVNAVVDVYQETNITTARAEATRRRKFFESQLRETDSLLAEAQLELSGMRTRSGVYSAQDKFTTEQSNLLQVEIRRAELRANRSMYETVLRSIEESQETGSVSNMSVLMSTPGMANPVISQLYSQLVGYQSEREGAITGPWAKAETHPDIQRLNALIAQTENRLIEAMRSQIAAIDVQINALGGLSARASGAMSQLPEVEVQEGRLIGQVDILAQLGQQLRAAYQEARMEETVEAGTVEIVHLATGASRVPSGALLKLALALVVGLILGGGAAFVRDKMDAGLYHPDELTRLLQLPSLAVIPRITPASSRIGGLKRFLPGSNGKDERRAKKNGFVPIDTEAFLTLRTNLLFSPSVENLKTLLVTSPAPAEGKTVTSANLAVALAQQGLRVLLVDCDLRRPSVAKAFGTSGDHDLTSVLLGEGSVWEAIRPSGIEGLDILPTVTTPPNPSELLGGEIMGKLLEEVSERYYMVIMDSPPVLRATDASVLGARANAVLLVVRAGATEREAAEQAMQQLSAVGARVVGAVLNDPDSSTRRYGGYYRYQYYSYSESG
jgi:capsular exopolysaccharide synthesis family protein